MTDMSFGGRVLEELRRRKLHRHLLYADIQSLKAVVDASGMRSYLAGKGHEVGEERTEVLHFVDFMEIQLLKRSLDAAGAAILLFGVT